MSKNKNTELIARTEIIEYNDEEAKKKQFNINDFETLMNSTAVNITDKEAIEMCKAVYDASIDKITKNNEFMASLVMIFSAIGEYYEAMSDKRVIQENQTKLIKRKIKRSKKFISIMNVRLDIMKRNLDRFENTPQDQRDKYLELKINELSKEIFDTQKLKMDTEEEVERLEINKDLKYFEITEKGDTKAKVHNHLMAKTKTILQLLKAHNLDLKKSTDSMSTDAKSIFKSLLKGDK